MFIAARRAWLGQGLVLLVLFVLVACDTAPETPTPLPAPPSATAPPASPTAAPTVAAPTATALATFPPTETEIPSQAPSSTAAASLTDTPPALSVLTATAPPLPHPPSPIPQSATATPVTTNTLLLEAITVMSQVATYHYTSTVHTLDNGRTLDAASEGEYQAPDAFQWTTATGGLTTTAVISGSLYYVSLASGEWTLLPNPVPERARQRIWSLIGQATDVVEVGQDPATDPDPTVHLTFNLPFASLPLESHPWTLAQGDVWLGVRDHRVRAFKLFAQEPLYETTYRVYLSNYDAPVRIDMPLPATPQPGLQGRLLYTHFDATVPTSGTLRVRDLFSGTDAHLRGSEGAATGAAWNPNGGEVIYSSVNDVLFLVDLTSASLINLGRGAAPAWSPDGATLAFIRGSGHTTRAWAAAPHVMDVRRLGTYFVQQLDWAPDGQRLVFSGWPATSDPESAAPQLFTMDSDGNDVIALPSVFGGAAWPRWSPDGTQLAFVAAGHLVIAGADGSGVMPLETTGFDSAPLWSPDGSELIYAHQDTRIAPRRLLLRSVDGGPAQPLTEGDDLPLDWRQ